MKRLILAAAVAAAGLNMAACATFDPGKLATAINQADSGPCYKDINVTVVPMMLFGWYVPIISGSFKKTCNPEKAPVAASPELKVGALVQ